MVSGARKRRSRRWLSPIDQFAMLVVIIWAIISLFPLYWMVTTSLEPPTLVMSVPPRLIPSEVTLANYGAVARATPLARWFSNSGFVATTRTVSALFFASLAGYAFARLQFAGREAFFWGLMLVMMIPGFVTILPLYRLMLDVNWVDKYWALIVPGITGGSWAVFLMRQFMRTLPSELGECGRIDGASEFGIYWRIYLPMTKPGLAVLAIFTFIDNWNDFLWPLLVTGRLEMRTLPVGLALLQGQRTTDYGLLMAGASLSAIPMVIVFMSFQRYFLQGITIGAVKG
ncbi:MAG: carbohydrate ABC transporter permease [Anaerolineae bacterium]